jgi:competence CoiA-like predicted nuclease
MNLVRPSNRVLNEVRIYTGESKAHIDKKIEVCRRLKEEGKHFITEAIFQTGGRADILVLDTFTAIEIVNTEKNESLIRKAEEYPDGIKLEVIRC